MQARMRVTYVRDARAERTSPSSDTRPAHVHAGKGPENARRRQPRRTGRSTRRDDALTTEPRPPMLIGRLQRGASPQQLHPGNRTIDSKNRSAKKKIKFYPAGGWARWDGNGQQCWLDWPRWGVCWCRAGTRFASKSQALCAAGALWRLTLPAVALCTLSARRCVPRFADDPGCSGTATVQDSQHVPLRCGARRVQRSPRTRRAVRAGCTMVQTCCDR